MAAVKLGKFSIGQATVNQTCSTLVSTVHISFLRLQLVEEQRNTPGGPLLEITARHQRPDKQKTQKFPEEKCSVLVKHETTESRLRDRLLSVPGGHLIWGQDRVPAPAVQGQRYLQVRWMHAGLARLQAPCHLLQLPLTSTGPE